MIGFILTRHWRDTPQGVRLSLWLATDEGPLHLEIPAQKSVCFIRQADLPIAQKFFPDFSGIQCKPVELKNCHGETVVAVYCINQRQLRQFVECLDSAPVDYWEADIKPVERFLMERFITAGLECDSSRRRYVEKNKSGKAGSSYWSLVSPKVKPVSYQPTLRMLSIDIETTMDAKTLYSIGVYSDQIARVFMVGHKEEVLAAQTNEQVDTPVEIVWCNDQVACLTQFFQWLQVYDPDVLIGWHVVQFDLWVLQSICERLKIPFAIGRDGQAPHWREDSEISGRRYVQIPGRVVLDGIELLRMAFYQFDSFSLQSVASSLLGDSKLLVDDDRGAAITQLYKENKFALAQYNLQDCILVWRIFEKTALLNFAIARSQLTGLSMDRMGGSVASFEYAYLPRLHRAGYVAPNLGEIESDVVSPGGYVLNSRPGLYQQVLVLDFKSLYPSIIRTFFIDPCAFWRAQHDSTDENRKHELIVPGFNGAEFMKDGSLLPEIIAELWCARDRAKAESNSPLSQAIKIIMNSFYGVLGSTGCRFFDPRVCSSITLRGHEVLQKSRDWIEEQGYQVIYGDTDSLFVWLGDEADANVADEIGQTLAAGLNQWWQVNLETDFKITSALEIEFETHYKHFLMPTIRGSTEGSKKRYAGIIEKNGVEQLVFKGLETVRNDWTLLAKNFQQQLYLKVFKGEPYQDFIVNVLQQLLKGALNTDLVYHKKMRRPVSGYQKSNPPHVKAARILEQSRLKPLQRGDAIDYVITLNGPEPIQCQQSNIDYEHYIEKQLKPVANSILGLIGDDFDEITSRQMQLI